MPKVLSIAQLTPLRPAARAARDRVADAWPFSRGPCLRRTLVLGHLLREHDPALRLGVAGAGDDLNAHAWLEIDGQPLEDVTSFALFQHAPTTEAG